MSLNRKCNNPLFGGTQTYDVRSDNRGSSFDNNNAYIIAQELQIAVLRSAMHNYIKPAIYTKEVHLELYSVFNTFQP